VGSVLHPALGVNLLCNGAGLVQPTYVRGKALSGFATTCYFEPILFEMFSLGQRVGELLKNNSYELPVTGPPNTR